MAMGENFSRTLEGQHETCYDFHCSLCEDDGKQCEAVKYCEECFVYLCDPCLREKHNKFPLNKRHWLLDQSKFTLVKKSALVSFPTKRCPKHPGELINIFCGNHDAVCCCVCKALEHGSCLKTQDLVDAAKGIQTSQEFQDIITCTKTLVSDVDQTLRHQKANLSRIAEEKQSARKTIAESRTNIKKYFDDIEKNSLVELDHRERTIVSRIEKNKKYLETTKLKAGDILNRLDTFKGDNECDLFVQVKTGLQFVNDALETIRTIVEAEEKPSIQFEINRNINNYITSIKSFGSFSRTGFIATPPRISTVPEVKTSSLPVFPARKQSDYNLHYSTQKCAKFDMKEKSDTVTCSIYSICQLPDNSFLITDWNNNKLKRLDQSLKLLDSVKLSGDPHSVCAVGPGQAAVSLFTTKKIQLVSVKKDLTLTHSFIVGNYCRGLVYIGDEFFVCCGDFYDLSVGYLEVYKKGGQLQRIIQCDIQRLSLAPDYITVSDDGQHLLVTSLDSGDITMLDLNGNVVNTFSHKDLKELTGICTDGTGRVFVCGSNSDKVFQLSPSHPKIEIILKKEHGITKPQGIYYDMKQSRLLVSNYRKNELFSFLLK